MSSQRIDNMDQCWCKRMQADGGLIGEWYVPRAEAEVLVEENERLRGALRVEYERHRGLSPWRCPEPECPYFGKPVSRGCGCYQDAEKKHLAECKFLLAELETER